MRINKILFAIFFLLSISVDAQIMFQRHYGGAADDCGNKIIQTSDGGYFIAAATESFGAGGRDIFFIRTNEYGDTLWTRTLGGAGYDQPTSLITTFDSCFILTGGTESFGASNEDVFLIKVNQNGDTLWKRTYGGIGWDEGADVKQTFDGGFMVVGTTTSYTSGFSSIYAIRTDEFGDTLWTKTYEKNYFNQGSSVILLQDGGFFICGGTRALSSSNGDCFLVRTDNQGDTLWTKTYGGMGDDNAFQACIVSGGIIISGTTTSFGAGGQDIFLSKLDENGLEIWMKTYGGVANDYGGAFTPTNDGGYILTGYTESFGAGGQDMYLIKTNSTGDTLWTKTFGKSMDEWGGGVIQTSDNGYIVSGYTNSYGNGFDVYLVKTSEDGISAINKTDRRDPDYHVYPNPSSGQITMVLPENVKLPVQCDVLDIQGKVVQSYSVKQNNQSFFINHKGIFFLRIENENTFLNKKLIIY